MILENKINAKIDEVNEVIFFESTGIINFIILKKKIIQV